MSDRHVFGSNPNQPDINPMDERTAAFHKTREEIQARFKAAVAVLDAQHKKERDALAANFDNEHLENSIKAGFRSRG